MMDSARAPAKFEKKVRKICLAFPEATEKETWGFLTFRVRNKIFSGISLDDDGTCSMSMKAEPGMRRTLLDEGSPFFYPKYVGSKGWIGIVINDETDWQRVAELIEDSYCAIAPKKLVAQLLD